MDEDKIRNVMGFIGNLTHTKGEWAGKKFTILPWEEDVLRPLFGSVDERGVRQYRTCYVEIPKKNGKSELCAAIALYMLCSDGEASPEIYGAAADRDQASLVYNVAAQMVKNSDALGKRLAVRDSRKRIINKQNNGFYQVLSSEVHCVSPDTIVDLENGSRMQAGQLISGVRILGWDGNGLAFGTIKDVKRQELSFIYRIKTHRGRILETTGEHRYWTMIPAKRSQDLTHQFSWKHARDLCIGDRISVAMGWPEKRDGGISVDEAWALGAWAGDGECGRFRFINANNEIVQGLRRFIESLGETLRSAHSTRQKQNGNLNGYPHEHQIIGIGKRRKSAGREWIRKHYGQKSRAHTKRIPKEIWIGDQRAWAAFLAGWLDTDGCVTKGGQVRWCSVSPQMLWDGQSLLARLGLNATISGYNLSINGKHQIEKLCKILIQYMRERNKKNRIAERARDLQENNYNAHYIDKIISIDIFESAETVSIEIDGIDTHVTNGLITHNTKHGLNPSCVIFDELHAQPNDELWRVLTAGTDYARKQQLVFVVTTAGIYDRESIWWRVREKARQIKDGIVEDPSFLPILYIADPEHDDPHDEELWKRVNPSLGHIFTLDRIRRDYEQAKQDLIEFEDFKRFRLNIPAKVIRRWMAMDRWDSCSNPISGRDLLKSRPVFGGLDLSSTTDLSAFILVFPPTSAEEDWEVIVKAYCPEDTIRQRSRQDRVDYARWVQAGRITATPGNVIDYEYIERDIIQAADEYDLREIGYDPWNATQLATNLLNNHGIQMVEVRQGVKSLSEPSKDILKAVLGGRLRHGGHPVLRWCTDNLVMVPDANENIRPVKDKSTDRIDLFVAMLIGWSRAVANMGTMVSIYETRGILTIE